MTKKKRPRPTNKLRYEYIRVHEDWSPCFNENIDENGTVSGEVLLSIIHTETVPNIWRVFITGADDFALHTDVSSIEEAEWIFEQAAENPEQDYLQLILGFERY